MLRDIDHSMPLWLWKYTFLEIIIIRIQMERSDIRSIISYITYNEKKYVNTYVWREKNRKKEEEKKERKGKNKSLKSGKSG